MQSTQITQYPELNELLVSHARDMREGLADNFVGYYIQGSFATGGADHTSDVDFIVVTNNDLSKTEVSLVEQIHKKIYEENTRWVRRLEYSFFPKNSLSRFSSPYHGKIRNHTRERDLWFFDHSKDSITRSDHCNTLVVRWVLREKGIIVSGPDPKTLIPEISSNVLRIEIKDTIIGKGTNTLKYPSKYDNRFFQSYLVLNYTRMLHNLYIGRIESKSQGVLWAKTNLDPAWLPLIEFCWRDRQDNSISVKHPSNSTVFNQALEFVKYVTELAEQYQI